MGVWEIVHPHSQANKFNNCRGNSFNFFLMFFLGALKDIRFFQSTADFLICKRPFQRFVREIMEELTKGTKAADITRYVSLFYFNSNSFLGGQERPCWLYKKLRRLF